MSVIRSLAYVHANLMRRMVELPKNKEEAAEAKRLWEKVVFDCFSHLLMVVDAANEVEEPSMRRIIEVFEKECAPFVKDLARCPSCGGPCGLVSGDFRYKTVVVPNISYLLCADKECGTSVLPSVEEQKIDEALRK